MSPRAVLGRRYMAAERVRRAEWVTPAEAMVADAGSLRAMALSMRKAAEALDAAASAVDAEAHEPAA